MVIFYWISIQYTNTWQSWTARSAKLVNQVDAEVLIYLPPAQETTWVDDMLAEVVEITDREGYNLIVVRDLEAESPIASTIRSEVPQGSPALCYYHSAFETYTCYEESLDAVNSVTPGMVLVWLRLQELQMQLMAFESFYREVPQAMDEEEIVSFMTGTMEEIEYFKQLFADYKRMNQQGRHEDEL